MYKEKTNSILLRYESDYVAGYNTVNVIMEMYDKNDNVDISMVVYPDNVISSYSPELTMKKSDITKTTAIRFNDNGIPQSIRQSVDEFASQGIQLLLTTTNDVLNNANVSVCDLGFVNFK